MSWCGFYCRCGCGQRCSCGGAPIVRRVGWRQVEREHFGRNVKEWVIVDLFADGTEVPEKYDWIAHHRSLTGDAPYAATHPAPPNENGHALVTCDLEGCSFARGHRGRHEGAPVEAAAE